MTNVARLLDQRSVLGAHLSLLQHIDRMVEWDWEVCFSHVLHEVNSIADCLAKYGFDVDRSGQVFFHPPGFALTAYLEDFRFLST
ncbi:hypothetical protein V6N12_028138 [Hibiscus sabdariffa]|uniref:RNase H type-1 domain-containing protein n=1 Tax=Hibiscus sabdariffa TaxID=183260 RepID=A0ABR2F4Y5_9ROSI